MVLWLDHSRAREILASAQRLGILKIWVGPDAWSSRTSVTDGYEPVARGAVTLQPLAAQVDGFDKYYQRYVSISVALYSSDICYTLQTFYLIKDTLNIYFCFSLNPNNNDRNPWFRTFWEDYFDCSLDSTDPTEACTGNEKISPQNGWNSYFSFPFGISEIVALLLCCFSGHQL